MKINMETLRSFAKRGAAERYAMEALLVRARKCPYCGCSFLPQTHNHTYCSYQCRDETKAEVAHVRYITHYKQLRKQRRQQHANTHTPA